MLKRYSYLFLTLSLFLFAGFGCKGLSQEQQAATKPVTLEYWTVFDDVDAIRVLVEKYRLDHPYLTVNVRQLRVDEIYPRLIESLADDKGPDIISVRNRWLGKLSTKLAVMPATVQDTQIHTVKSTLGEKTTVTVQNKATPTVDQIDKEYVQAVKNDVIRDKKIYGLPLSFDTMALYYNKDLLDRAGVAEPPKTWEEFQVAVKKLTKYDKTTGKISQSGAALGTGNNVPGSDDLLYILFRQSALNFVNKNGQAVFNAPSRNNSGESPVATVLNFYTDFANSTRDTYTWNEGMNNALDNFVNGSLGFFFGYNYHFSQIKARSPQLNFGILPMLQLNPEKQVNVANYWVQTVVGKSKQQNEAWNLLLYLTHSAATKEYLDRTVRPTALRTYIGAQSEKTELVPFISQILIADNWYKGRDYEAAAQALNSMLHEWLLPSPDPERVGEYQQAVLDRAASKINQTL